MSKKLNKKTSNLGRLIAIEGTDCSGKETQAKLLAKALREKGYKVKNLSFPIYNSPSGQIVGGPYLGKTTISPGLFNEGANNVDPKVASLYFAADRRYNSHIISDLLAKDTIIILDRYVESNMAHQGGKITNKADRMALYKWLEDLEYNLLELPRPDTTFFLHLSTKCSIQLRDDRKDESPDQHELDYGHLKNAERAYLELSELYNFTKITCDSNNDIRPIEDIHQEIMSYF